MKTLKDSNHLPGKGKILRRNLPSLDISGQPEPQSRVVKPPTVWNFVKEMLMSNKQSLENHVRMLAFFLWE